MCIILCIIYNVISVSCRYFLLSVYVYCTVHVFALYVASSVPAVSEVSLVLLNGCLRQRP